MDKAEFDAFAEEYRNIHAKNIGVSGESPEFFAEYKIRDLARIAVSRIETKERVRILDFGCGVGASMPYLKEYFPGAQIDGLDVSERSLEIARERFDGIARFSTYDGFGSIPYSSESFDLCFSACVFHHIGRSEHVGLLTEIRRVLGRGGALVLFEHNPVNPLTRRAVRDCPFDRNAVLIPAQELKARFEEAGFRDVTVRFRIFFPRMLRILRPLERFLEWLPLGAQYFVAGVRD